MSLKDIDLTPEEIENSVDLFNLLSDDSREYELDEYEKIPLEKFRNLFEKTVFIVLIKSNTKTIFKDIYEKIIVYKEN